MPERRRAAIGQYNGPQAAAIECSFRVKTGNHHAFSCAIGWGERQRDAGTIFWHAPAENTIWIWEDEEP